MAKTKTYIIFLILVAFFGAVAFSIDRNLLFPVSVTSLITILFGYVFFTPLVVFFTGAKVDQEASQKFNFKIYLVNSRSPFAFALSSKILLITTSLRNLLNRPELEAIIAREHFNISRGETGLVLLFNLTSWKREFDADAFAAQKTSDPETLINAITKIGRTSHFDPPVAERVKLLRAM
jgi:Zn-dependent protease with chaperone function